jgi:hypothetical protein
MDCRKRQLTKRSTGFLKRKAEGEPESGNSNTRRARLI